MNIINNFNFFKERYSFELGLNNINSRDNIFIIYFHKTNGNPVVSFTNLATVVTNLKSINYYEPLSTFDKDYIFNTYYAAKGYGICYFLTLLYLFIMLDTYLIFLGIM